MLPWSKGLGYSHSFLPSFHSQIHAELFCAGLGSGLSEGRSEEGTFARRLWEVKERAPQDPGSNGEAF